MGSVGDDNGDGNEEDETPEEASHDGEGPPFPGLTPEQRAELMREVVPPRSNPADGLSRGLERRRTLARKAFAAIEGDDIIRSIDQPETLAKDETPWLLVFGMCAASLDFRTSAVEVVRGAYGPNAARWPGRWRRVRALRVAWAMGEFAERACFRFAPNPTIALLRDVEALAGPESACALRHPEVIGAVGPMTAPQAARVVLLCTLLALVARIEAESAPAFGHARADEQGVLHNAVMDFLHATAPLAAAGDPSAALAVDLARAFRVHLATAAQREAAQEHHAMDLEAFVPDDIPGYEALRGMWRGRGERLRPYLSAPDPFEEVTSIGRQWRPSMRDETEWLRGWRESLAFASSGWSSSERACAACVMIAEGRGRCLESEDRTFLDSLAACSEGDDDESIEDPDERAVVRALVALGYNRRTFLRAQEEQRRRAKKLRELNEERQRSPAAWRKTVSNAVAVAKGVNKTATDRLCCSLTDLRDWVESDEELAKMITTKTRKR